MQSNKNVTYGTTFHHSQNVLTSKMQTRQKEVKNPRDEKMAQNTELN